MPARGRRTPRAPTRPRPKPRTPTVTEAVAGKSPYSPIIPRTHTPAVPTPSPMPTGVPGGPGISWQPPIMTPTLQALYERQVGETAVAGPAITAFGSTLTPYSYNAAVGGLGVGAGTPDLWVDPSATQAQSRREVAFRMQAKQALYKQGQMYQPPDFKPPPPSGGGGYYRPTRGRSYGGGSRATRVSQTRRANQLVNWRIGL